MIIRVRADARRAGRRAGREGARPAHANPWLQIKIVPRGGEGLWPPLEERGAGRGLVCFVLENLNSNPRRGRSRLRAGSICVYGDGAWRVCIAKGGMQMSEVSLERGWDRVEFMRVMSLSFFFFLDPSN